jgi:hypothetical protein
MADGLFELWTIDSGHIACFSFRKMSVAFGF